MQNPAANPGVYGTNPARVTGDRFLDIIEGDVFLEFKNYLEIRKELAIPDIEKISDCTKQTVGVFLQPNLGANQSRTNILVGNVQSGKTTLIEGIISLASDCGIPLVAVLTGTKKNLTRQTIDELVDYANFMPSGRLKIVSDLSGLTPEEAQRNLNNHASAETRIRNFAATLVIPIIKNANSVNNLCDFLARLDTSRIDSFLIIDDEADEFSLDTTVRNANVSASACYRACTRLRQLMQLGTTYLQVTATPQGPLLIDPTDPLSPDYVTISEPGEMYCGGPEYFLSADSDLLVRVIPPQERPQDWVDTPATSQRIPPSLIQAFHYFLAAGGILLADGLLSTVTMMIHPASERRFHDRYQEYINRLIARYTTALHEDFEVASADIEAELTPLLNELLAHYNSTSSREEIIANSIRMIFRSSVKILNGDNDFRNTNWSTYWNTETAHFILGAQCIARGFVVKNLVTSYLPRSNQPANPSSQLGQVDTIQQQARFFGYKKKFLKLCRVFVAEDIRRQFIVYTLHESVLRNTLKLQYRRFKPYQGLQLPIAPRFAATRRNILLNNPMTTPLTSWFKEGYPYAVSIEDHKDRVCSIADFLKVAFPDAVLPSPGAIRLSPSQPSLDLPSSSSVTLAHLQDFLSAYKFSLLDSGLGSISRFISYLMEVNPQRFNPGSQVPTYVFTKSRRRYPDGADSAYRAFGRFFVDDRDPTLTNGGPVYETHSDIVRTRFNRLAPVLQSNLSRLRINPHGGANDQDDLYNHPAMISLQILFFQIPTLSGLVPHFLSLPEIANTPLADSMRTWFNQHGQYHLRTSTEMVQQELPYTTGIGGQASSVFPVICIKFPPLFDVIAV